VCHRIHQGRLPAQHCRQKQGLAQPLKQKANEDSATTVKYEALAFAGSGTFFGFKKTSTICMAFFALLLPQKESHLPTNTAMA
jgi:hypothetical protein